MTSRTSHLNTNAIARLQLGAISPVVEVQNWGHIVTPEDKSHYFLSPISSTEHSVVRVDPILNPAWSKIPRLAPGAPHGISASYREWKEQASMGKSYHFFT